MIQTPDSKHSSAEPLKIGTSASHAASTRCVRQSAHRYIFLPLSKPNAYGYGLLPAAKTVIAAALDAISLVSLDDAVRLREAGIRVPILVYAGMFRLNTCSGRGESRPHRNAAQRRIACCFFTARAERNQSCGQGRGRAERIGIPRGRCCPLRESGDRKRKAAHARAERAPECSGQGTL